MDRIATELKKLTRDREAMSLPNRALVESVHPATEQVSIETFANVGTQKTSIRHPYMGVNSWIRVMPESGTPVLTQQRGDYTQLEIWGYISNNLGNRHARNKSGPSKQFLFRELNEGEIEFMSRGRAYMHMADTGDMEIRGGTVKLQLQQTNLQTVQQSPTYQRQLHLYDPQTLAHEERFGVVRRPNSQNPYIISDYIKNSDGSFAIEHARWINKKDGSPLVELQEGGVFNSQGKEVKHSTTTKPLRMFKKWYDAQGQPLSLEIDEDLNILVANSNTSKETTFKLGTQNVLDVSAKQLKMSFLSNGQMSFTNSFQIRASKHSVVCPNINLGSDTANIGVVLGPPLTSGVLSPSLATIAASFSTLAAAAAFNTPADAAVKAALVGAASTLSQIAASSLSKVTSTIVKVSA